MVSPQRQVTTMRVILSPSRLNDTAGAECSCGGETMGAMDGFVTVEAETSAGTAVVNPGINGLKLEVIARWPAIRGWDWAQAKS